MKKEINLEEIFNNNFDCYTQVLVEWKEIEELAMSKEKFKIVMMETIKQVLDLAAENGKVVYDSETLGAIELSTSEKRKYVVDITSIKSTIFQIII